MSQTLALRDAVAQYFKARPNQWIRAELLEGPGGRQAWRTRVSDARRDLGMDIQNRVTVVRTHSANCPGIAAPDHPEACQCGRPGRYTLSEYKYVPPAGQPRLPLPNTAEAA